MKNMLTYDQAHELIINSVNPMPVVSMPLSQLQGCFLAEPVLAPFQLPIFDNSAVDGYGVIVSDLKSASRKNPVQLSIIGSIEAGGSLDPSGPAIQSGQCLKILTGAPIPQGVEAVVMKEYCSPEKPTDIGLFSRGVEAGENVRRRGEEVKEGDCVVPGNMRISPPIVGVMASFGFAEFRVFKQPRIAILTTGNELVEPGSGLKTNQIYNSNSYAVEAACKALGIADVIKLHALDTREDTIEKLQTAIDSADVIICTGGVSVGDKDLVKPVLEEDFNVETILWRIAIKPGKPVYFGKKGEKYFFGLPGNPVSALVTFHLFVKPALRKMQGVSEPKKATRSAVLRRTIRKKSGRMEFVRGIQESTQDGNLVVEPTKGQDSHMLSGLAVANCLIHFGLDEEVLDENCRIPVQDLSWESY